MAEAIAYVWLTEGTYDEEYVATRTLGFEEFCAYVLGEEDGVAKTPEWAAEICDVPPRRSLRWPGNGPPTGPCWPPAPRAESPGPAGRPTAPSGPG